MASFLSNHKSNPYIILNPVTDIPKLSLKTWVAIWSSEKTRIFSFNSLFLTFSFIIGIHILLYFKDTLPNYSIYRKTIHRPILLWRRSFDFYKYLSSNRKPVITCNPHMIGSRRSLNTSSQFRWAYDFIIWWLYW